MQAESSFIILLVILSLGLIIPELFRKLHLPFITGIILTGAILGPSGTGVIENDPVIEFFGFMGMIFLMLMAGIDTDIERLKKMRHKIFIIAGFNGFIPFATGFLIAFLFGYDLMTSVLAGVIFIASSVAIVISMLKDSKMYKKRIGQITASSAIMLDAIGLMAITMILKERETLKEVPYALYLLLLLGSVMVVFYLLPKFTEFMFKHYLTSGNKNSELRLAIIVVMAVLAFFSLLDVHPVLSAFITGVTLSHIIKSEKLYSKIKTIGNTLFVPVFLFIVGMELDFSVLIDVGNGTEIIIVFVIGIILSKLLSGFIGGRIIKLSVKESALYGSASTIHLTTALAVTYAARSMNLLDDVMMAAIISITIITTTLGPVLFRWVNAHVE
ncbi:MAG: cation:proton antiporter [Candidatus Woesearchaeota archaeon]